VVQFSTRPITGDLEAPPTNRYRRAPQDERKGMAAHHNLRCGIKSNRGSDPGAPRSRGRHLRVGRHGITIPQVGRSSGGSLSTWDANALPGRGGGVLGERWSETMVMLRLVPGDPIPPPPGDTALGAIATDLGSWTLGGVHRPRPAALGARIGVDLGVGGARTAVTRRLRITDYNGNYLGTDAPTETAWGGYARVGGIVDVQRLTRTLGIYLGIDGAAMSVGGERRRSGESRPESASDWVTSRGRPRRR